MAIPEERSRQFFGVVLPQMQRLALRVSEVCPQPIPLLETGRGGTVELTQAQVCCLLCHAFFCTMPYRFRHLRIRNATRNDPAMEALEWRSYPSVNFLELYGAQNMAYRCAPPPPPSHPRAPVVDLGAPFPPVASEGPGR